MTVTVESLQEENQTLRNSLKLLNAEKTAIDQTCLKSIQENINLRTKLILCEENIAEKNKELAEIKGNPETKPGILTYTKT